MAMQTDYKTQHALQLEKIMAALPKSADAMFRQFTAQFYAKMPVTELEKLDPKHAVTLAHSAFGFAQKREGSKPKIRIYTPVKKLHGYDSKYPAIELLNDDMPFLVDSLTAELTRHGFTIRETIHPILTVKRDKKGALQSMGEGADGKAESLIHFEISTLPEGLTPQQLQDDLDSILQHIQATVSDWKAITAKVGERIGRLSKSRNHFDDETIKEVEAFLNWLVDRNFVFMGYAEYDFFDDKGREKLLAVPDSKLGVLKISDEIAPQGLEALPPELRHFLLVPQLIEITKSNRRSPVHRPVPMDYIGLKRFDTKGNVIGEARFLGLFTSNVYYQSAEAIPLLRQKILHTLERSEFAPASHDGKALRAILEFLPRDEIFQMSDDDLFETSIGILALEAKPGVRVFVRRDAFERFISVMAFVPKELFSTELRRQIQGIMETAFNGVTSSFSTEITEAPLARLHLIVKTTPGEIPTVDMAKIESEIAKRAYLWTEQLFDSLMARHEEQKAEKFQRAYGAAFPQNYINRYDTMAAVHDIDKIGEAVAANALALELFHVKNEDDGVVHLKIYNPNDEIAISDILPMLENAGFRAIDEHPFLITPQGEATPQVWIRDFKLRIAPGMMAAFDASKPLIEESLLHVWQGDMENDRFNALVLKAGLSWRQVAIIRAYARYLKQVGFTYAQATIEQAMNQHPAIAKNIVALFINRFDPATKDRDAKQAAIQKAIEEQLAQVSNVVEDAIIRRYVDIIMATLRTNYFITPSPLEGSRRKENSEAVFSREGRGGGIASMASSNKIPPLPQGEREYPAVLSFKLDSHKVPELPLPKPFKEIFVYGTRVEGIHLRGGKVARGGLRWSDRHEDFRTEVLGLMKAQMVKNSVIVPVGSKGGFVVKHPPADGGREAVMQEGIACYKLYLRGLLDITDNIVQGKVVPPKQVVRHDENDPYLVVAADKGTATFSDIANGVSAEYNFWLGDAFASGGSVGYDHKKMAITARGGWVSVSRHFHEMGVDIEKQDFTAAGIGDMAGDVFGNGMLLSDRIKLVAAFNHIHIFLDPAPNTKTSFAERKRLFDLPRSTWKDYNASLISGGGGIFERSAKSIALSKEMQAVLGIAQASLTPDELIRAILLAPVDLLWNGGIGTYVKAEDETHEQVGDRTNNAVRVNGSQLRCKVVGEGGNLGFTQRGRIEYARKGGRINTDAIDNSAGVDCSDHEVNIKIAFSQEIAKGRLTFAKRDKLLTGMTEDVAHLVLKDNVLQTQAITVAELQGVRLLESQARLMHVLERQGQLDRAIEFLPSDKQLAELRTARKGLTRPELAVLLSYSKMVLYKDLLDSSLPDEAYFTGDLKRYFPKAMVENFPEAIATHPLRREIIATVVTNSLVNRAGITFFSDIAEDLGVAPRDIAAAYALARDAFGLRIIWKEIEICGASVETQVEMYASAGEFLERVTVWLLRNLPLPLDVEHIREEIAPGIADLQKHGKHMQSETLRENAGAFFTRLVEQGVGAALADKIAGLELMSSAFDIISVSHRTGLPVDAVGRIYFEVGSRVRLGWLRLCAGHIATLSHWERLAVQSLVSDFYDEQRRLTMEVIEHAPKKPETGIAVWEKAHQADLTRFARFIDDFSTGDSPDIARLMVALQHVRTL
jgi:glutamate dehydrogenase